MAVSESVAATRERLGPVGTWLAVLRRASADVERAAVRRIEDLGYGSVWDGESIGFKDVFAQNAVMLCASARIITGAGIATIWARHPAAMQAAAATLGDAWPGRFVLGLGISHARVVEQTGQVYERPLERMRQYLDGMDEAAATVPRTPIPVPRVLAALRPRMLELARERTDGAHTYFVPTAHTARAREILGPDRLLIPEQAVYLSTDPAEARAVARDHMTLYLTLPNYVNNLKHLGYTDQDLADGGSDRLVDALVAWGDADAIAARVLEHRDAGADHVLLQPLAPDVDGAVRQLEELVPAVLPG